MNRIARELVALCRIFNAFEEDALCCGDITVAQCVVMQRLLGGSRTVSELAGDAHLSVSAATRLLDGLEARGWIQRARGDGEDRRQVRAVLTASGRTEAERLRQATDALVDAALAGLPLARRKEIESALRLLRETLSGAAARCCPVRPRTSAP